MATPRRIAVITDVHANLPALDAALRAIRDEGCEAIYHTGDVIGFGPFPAECLNRLLHTPHVRFVIGNHDAWFAHGIPASRSASMTAGEASHHHWGHAQIAPSLRAVIAGWPYAIEEAFGPLRVAFAHYGLDDTGREFVPVVQEPSGVDLDRIFARHRADLVLYGHYHPAADTSSQARYVNPGSLGCFQEPVARFVVLEIKADGTYEVQKRAVPYDMTDLFRQFVERDVPERDFVCTAIFGRPDTTSAAL